MNKQQLTKNTNCNFFQLISSMKIMMPLIIIGLVSSIVWSAQSTAVGATDVFPEVTVFKSATCNCCNKWVDHLEHEGFTVTTHDKSDNEMKNIKASLGINSQLASCHTATVGNYAIEGHVPAADIMQLLTEKPKTNGLTAPGMPQHSPGMQPISEKPNGYDVLLFNKEGNTQLFHSY
jgi:hypothetical protein